MGRLTYTADGRHLELDVTVDWQRKLIVDVIHAILLGQPVRLDGTPIAATPTPTIAPAPQPAAMPAAGDCLCECGATFARHDSLLVHRRTVHNGGRAEPRSCQLCTATFAPRRRDQTFCSDTCRHRWHSRAAEERRQTGTTVPADRTCVQCSAAFSGSPSARYCSDRCRTAASSARRAPARPMRPCDTCGASYRPKRDEQQFCSAACKEKARVRPSRRRVAAPDADVPAFTDPALPRGFFPKPVDDDRPVVCPHCDHRMRYRSDLAHHLRAWHTTADAPTPYTRPDPAPLAVEPAVPAKERISQLAARLERAAS